jgi:hypothetical protein
MNERDAQERLTRTLREHASGAPDGSPIGLDDVRRSARGIRRRRRMTTGLVAAAVVAVAVPVGIGVTGTTGTNRPVAPASDAPSTDASPSVPPSSAPSPKTPRTPVETALTIKGAGPGDAPAIPYLQGRTVVTPEAGQQDLPAAYDTVAAYRGGWLAIERREGTPYVVQVDASGALVKEVPGGGTIAVSADGTELSWTEGRTLFLDETNGHSETPTSIRLPVGLASSVGFLSPGTVVFLGEGATSKFGVTNFAERPVTTPVLGLRAVNESRGLIGVQTSFDSDNGTSCWKVATNRPGDTEPETCDWTIESFSVDGRHFVGYPSGTDGIGSSTVALLDAETLDVVATFDRPGNGEIFVNDVAWEDDAHVLATLYDDDAWHIVRLGLDGTIENLDASLEDVEAPPGTPEEAAYHFAARP